MREFKFMSKISVLIVLGKPQNIRSFFSSRTTKKDRFFAASLNQPDIDESISIRNDGSIIPTLVVRDTLKALNKKGWFTLKSMVIDGNVEHIAHT